LGSEGAITDPYKRENLITINNVCDCTIKIDFEFFISRFKFVCDNYNADLKSKYKNQYTKKYANYEHQTTCTDIRKFTVN